MKRLINISILTLLLMTISSGCARKVCLKYDQCSSVQNVNNEVCNKKIGVFTFADNREDIPPKAYGTVIEMVTAELPIAYESHNETETTVCNYVTSSLKKELTILGAHVSDDSVYSKTIPFENCRAQVEELPEVEADRVIIGRIRFFRWTQAGFAGLAFQSSMPDNQFFTEIQVMVINPENKKILWAGNGCARLISRGDYPDATEKENTIYEGLKQALSSIITKQEFLDSLT